MADRCPGLRQLLRAVDRWRDLRTHGTGKFRLVEPRRFELQQLDGTAPRRLHWHRLRSARRLPGLDGLEEGGALRCGRRLPERELRGLEDGRGAESRQGL